MGVACSYSSAPESVSSVEMREMLVAKLVILPELGQFGQSGRVPLADWITRPASSD